MKKILMLASIALVTVLGCDRDDRSMTADRDRTTTPPPVTTPGVVDKGVSASSTSTMTRMRIAPWRNV